MTFEQAAIDAFTNGPIRHQDLDPMGISELTVDVAGVKVRASWYGGTGAARDIRVDGAAYPGDSGPMIIRAARTRAKRLLAEKLDSLNALVRNA